MDLCGVPLDVVGYISEIQCFKYGNVVTDLKTMLSVDQLYVTACKHYHQLMNLRTRFAAGRRLPRLPDEV